MTAPRHSVFGHFLGDFLMGAGIMYGVLMLPSTPTLPSVVSLAVPGRPDLYNPAWPATPFPTDEIAPGQVWCSGTLDTPDPRDPFGPRTRPKKPCLFAAVVVLEVKDGWVRCQIGDGENYPDKRSTIEDFCRKNDRRIW
jgi:hypothetical protein